MIVVLLGLPAAGKGTYAGILQKTYRWPHISAGELLRQAAASGSSSGVKAKGYMDKGMYVPDDIVVSIVKERLSMDDCRKGAFLDNFPGNVNQARASEGIINISLVIYFNASKDTIIGRLTGRLTCRKCGAIYHVNNIPPKKDGVCDKCGGELYQRADQTPGAIEQRLKTYSKELMPLIEYFKGKGLLVEVDSNPPIDEVDRIIKPALKAIKRAVRDKTAIGFDVRKP
ncbi:adenylate kinase [Candidatus Woesearchaeota archaeon CG10_big_fil_rev_8_21_14_0_10_47_5]|nr:MAG: adenylate kinase [Candidatus Woesearchaeota archaeon CG10_big_fil_rev_8_21_14_0_10_47_5]HII30285.1 nucleoside monophosphate kinase [Candidatus Woesearchaeota archaeon]